MSPEDRDPELAAHRDQFLTTLPSRLDKLAAGAHGLRARPDSETNRAALTQRLQAMREAALALDLDSIAGALSDGLIALAGDRLETADLDLLDEALAIARELVPARRAAAPRLPELAAAPPPTLVVPAASEAAPPKPPTLEITLEPEGEPEPETRTLEARAARGGARSSEGVLAGRRVLVADDDSAVVWQVASTLRRAGATVIEARDGLAAWQSCLESAPELVLCDVMMPRLDGFALCRSLKRDVVLAGVPVILLSWREDLLQRARELGAQADGYLAKDTPDHVLVARCEEALAARAVLEARFAENATLNGRLDGCTPRYVLELASRASRPQLVEFSDAGFAYEAHFDDGVLVEVVRRGEDGVECGEAVLAGLLGMRAGRFVVRPFQVETRRFEISLERLLEPHVLRIRAACRLVRGVELRRVARLELDTKVLAPYRAASPPVAQQVVDALVDGVLPSRLRSSVSAALLEDVLVDLAIRGALVAARDEDGKDLFHALETQPTDARLHTPLPPKTRPAAAEEHKADVVFSERLGKRSEWQPGLSEDLPPQDAAPRVEVATAGAEPPTAVESKAAPKVTAVATPSVANPAPVAKSAAVANAAPVATTAPVAKARPVAKAASVAEPVLDLAQVLFAQLCASPVQSVTARTAGPELETETPAALRVKTPGPAQDSNASRAATAQRSAEAHPKGTGAASTAPQPEPRKLELARSLGAKVESTSSADADVTPERPRTVSAEKLTVKVASDVALPGLVAAFGRVVAGLETARERAAQLLAKSAAWTALDLDGDETPEPVRQVEAAPASAVKRDPAPQAKVEAAPAAVVKRDPEPAKVEVAPAPAAKREAEAPAKVETLQPVAAAAEETAPVKVVEAAPAKVEAAPPLAVRREPKAPAVPIGVAVAADEATNAERAVAVVPKRVAPPPKPVQARVSTRSLEDFSRLAPPEDADATDPNWLPPVDGPDSDVVVVSAARFQRLRSIGRTAMPFALVVFGGYGAFTLVDRVSQTVPLAESRPSAPVAAATVAAVASTGDQTAAQRLLAAAPAATEKGDGLPREAEGASPDLDSQLLPLPDGVVLAGDKGLLEINSGDKHKIYVAGVFVGRGPARRVPLAAGTHEVRTRLGPDERSYQVVVEAGKRTRLEPVRRTAGR